MIQETFSKDVFIQFNKDTLLSPGQWEYGCIDKEENNHIKEFKDYPLITRSAIAQAGLEVEYFNKWNGYHPNTVPVIIKNFGYNFIEIKRGSYKLARFRDTLSKCDHRVTDIDFEILIEDTFNKEATVSTKRDQIYVPILSKAVLPPGKYLSLHELSHISGTHRNQIHTMLGINEWIPLDNESNGSERFILGKTQRLKRPLPKDVYGVVSRLNRYSDEIKEKYTYGTFKFKYH